MSGRTLRERVDWRVRNHLRALAVALLGRPVRCSQCGQVMFRAISYVRRGRVHLFGAKEFNVRMAFTGKEVIEFRHLELDRCPASERPWVRPG